MPFRISLYKLVHEFLRYRPAFRHVSTIVYVPYLQKKILVILRGVGYQCRLGDKLGLQSSCKFVCLHHSVQIIMLMNLSAHLKKRSG